VQWTRAWGDRARIGISSDAYRIRYQSEEAQASDSNLVAIGANGTYLLHERSGTLVVRVYIGEDNAVAGRVDGDRRIYGLSIGGQRRILPQVMPSPVTRCCAPLTTKRIPASASRAEIASTMPRSASHGR
jgi:hypothetical protein